MQIMLLLNLLTYLLTLSSKPVEFSIGVSGPTFLEGDACLFAYFGFYIWSLFARFAIN